MRYLLLCCLFVIVSCFFAEAKERITLVEHFTSAGCGPCVLTNSTVDPVYEMNSDKVVVIKYQVNIGYCDPMYFDNPGEPKGRSDYYKTTSVPEMRVDGSFATFLSYPNPNLLDTKIKEASAVDSKWDIDLSYEMLPPYATVKVTMKVKSLEAQTGTFRAHIVLLENEVTYTSAPGTNGERIFSHVMRKMLPDLNGTILKNSWGANEEQTIIQEVAVPAYYKSLAKLSVVGFIQDNDTKSVKQTAYAGPQKVNGYDVALLNRKPSTYLLTNGSVPEVIIKNKGTQPVTDVTVKLLGSSKSYNWKGNLQSGESQSIELTDMPAVVRNFGVDRIVLSLIINSGEKDIDITDNVIEIPTVRFANAISLPIFEDFEVSSRSQFLENSIVFDPNSGGTTYIYYSQTENLGVNNSSRALLFRNYMNYAVGDVDEYYLPAFNLSSESNPELSFYYNYCSRSGAAKDSLFVQISVDQGITWSDLYKKGGTELNTVPDMYPVAQEFLPTSQDGWKKVTLGLNNYVKQPYVIVKFKVVNGNNNTLALDQIRIAGGGSGISKVDKSIKFIAYPAIARDIINISFELQNQSNAGIKIYNIAGKEVYRSDLGFLSPGNYAQAVNVSSVDAGTYLLVLNLNGKIATQKIIIIK